MASSTDVLIFVEDPGAANFVAELPAALAERGLHARLLTDGSATDYLQQRGVSVETAPRAATAESVLASAQPRLLTVGTSENPDTLGLALVAQARSTGVHSVGVVDGAANAEHRFRGRSDAPLAYAPDWLLVPDEWTKDAYIALGYPEDRAIECGHPHYDHVRAVAFRLAADDRKDLRRSLLPGASDESRVVVFVAESSNGLNGQQYQRSADYTLTGRGKSTGRTEVVLEEFADAVRLATPLPYLVLRLHPKNTAHELATYLDEFDLVSRGGSPLEWLYVADLVVGMTSMSLVEAALLGRPTLSILPRKAEVEWLPTIRSGITPCVTTREELRSSIVDMLRQGPETSYPSLDSFFASGSLDRAAKTIEGILNRTIEVSKLAR